jgi:hypothetical protein
MKEGRDLAVALITSAVLLLGVGYLAQCSGPSRPPGPPAKRVAASSATESEGAKTVGRPDAAREMEEKEDDEEREKIQRVGRALQTIGADPEMRKTLGIPR